MVAWSFFPRSGGSVTTVLQLSQALVRRGLEVDIIAPLLEKDLAKAGELGLDSGIRVHWAVSSFAKDYDSYPSRFLFLLKLISVVRRLSPEVAVFHAHDFNIGLFAALLGTAKPVLGVFGADPLFEIFNYGRQAGIGYEELPKARTAAVLRKIIRAAISLFSGGRLTVIGCNGASNEAIGRYHSGPVVNIPVGLDLGQYKKPENGAEPRGDSLLFVGRLVCWKDLDTAIAAFRAARELRRGLSLICVGGGPLSALYREKYKDENIVFSGEMDYRSVIGYYHRARLLLVSSRYETFGITVSEAMAAGLPIVASDLPAFHDRLTDRENCCLVKCGDAEAFAVRISELLDDPEKRTLFAARSLDIIRDHDVNAISGRYTALYERLSERCPGAHPAAPRFYSGRPGVVSPASPASPGTGPV